MIYKYNILVSQLTLLWVLQMLTICIKCLSEYNVSNQSLTNFTCYIDKNDQQEKLSCVIFEITTMSSKLLTTNQRQFRCARCSSFFHALFMNATLSTKLIVPSLHDSLQRIALLKNLYG